MKPTINNGNENPPKASLSKSMKKSSKSRSKLSKSATSSIQASLQQTTNAQEAATPTTIQDLPKEKAHHRSYAGFGSKTIKIIWEQHNTSDTEIMPEVYSKFAEDLTYRTWELINNIKIFSRHSGGRVTVDLINEVLKDSDVPPILGATDTEWDKVEYDGHFFFNSDYTVELRDEYLKEITPLKFFNLDAIYTWYVPIDQKELMMELHRNIIRALFMGNDESFKFGLNVVANSRRIGCLVQLLLKKSMEILAFGQTVKATKKCLEFLKALLTNIHSNNVECRAQLYHLCEILLCILLGTYNSIKPPLIIITDKKKESMELEKNFIENSDQEIKKEIVNLNQMDVDDIRNEYEALFKMVERNGFHNEHNDSETPSVDEIKVTNVMGPPQPPPPLQPSTSSSAATNEIIKNLQKTSQQIQTKEKVESNLPSYNENLSQSIKQEVVEEQIVEEEEEQQQQQQQQKQEIIEENKTDETQEQEHNDITLSPYQAEMCDLEIVDFVTSTIGWLGAHFGYFQSECIYSIQKRMEKFFNQRENIFDKDYEFISRCVRGLIALGDYGFREIIPFLDKIDPLYAPETLCNDFSLAAVFLKGNDDIFLYEWLEELCGDKLLPFNIYSFKKHQTVMTKLYDSLKKSTYNDNIKPKIRIKCIERNHQMNNDNRDKITDKYFPDMKLIEKTTKMIDFKFAGCKPINIKLKTVKKENIETINNTIFNSKIILNKRKYFKISRNKKKIIPLSNYCFLQI